MAVGSALLPVQKAIYTLLTGDSTLVALVTGIFDEVPEDQAFPYVVIGDASEGVMDTFTKKGRLPNLTVVVWSNFPGFSQGLAIADRTIFLINRVFLNNITPFTSVYAMYKTGVTTRSSDGITRQVKMTFDLFVEET